MTDFFDYWWHFDYLIQTAKKLYACFFYGDLESNMKRNPTELFGCFYICSCRYRNLVLLMQCILYTRTLNFASWLPYMLCPLSDADYYLFHNLHCLLLGCFYALLTFPAIGGTCQSWAKLAGGSGQSLHSKTILLIPRCRVLVSSYGISAWWWHYDPAYERRHINWKCC